MRRAVTFILIAGILACAAPAFSAQLLMRYGFENWTGSRSTTSGYPFSSTYEEYCLRHERCSEVVRSYNGWTPHSGNYFFLRNDSPDFPLSPPVPGITVGSVNDVGDIGQNGRACSQNGLDISRDIKTGEIFISFWARNNKGFATIQKAGWCKWIRVYTDGGPYGVVYMHLSTSSISPEMRFFCRDEGLWLGSPVILKNAFDGNWHKYSFYINFNKGIVRGWYDVENETASNATKSWQASDGKIANATRPDYFVIQGNFSAMQPTEMTYHALDDIEIWDGMPTATSTQDTAAPRVGSLNPASGATSVPVTANIVAHVLDSGSGVDSSSITMTVNGNRVAPSISGTKADYTLTYKPASDLPYETRVQVIINAKDLAGNAMSPVTYTFTTEPKTRSVPPISPIGVFIRILQKQA